MNFNLKDSAKRKKGSKVSKKSALGFGLNTRKNNESSVLQDGSSSSSDGENDTHNNTMSSKKSVNLELAAEQTALRKRAEKAMISLSGKSNVYEYDADYESFSSGHQLKANDKNDIDKHTEDQKESRYIESLMKKAKERKQEREIILERKIAREQEAECSKDEYSGKDKFVTKGYKRVLEEREVWLEREKKKLKVEEEEDVTKRKGTGVMGLYSNFNSARDGEEGGKVIHKMDEEGSKAYEINQEFLNDSKNFDKQKSRLNSSKYQAVYEEDGGSVDAIDDELREHAARATRIQKILNARDHYLSRACTWNE